LEVRRERAVDCVSIRPLRAVDCLFRVLGLRRARCDAAHESKRRNSRNTVPAHGSLLSRQLSLRLQGVTNGVTRVTRPRAWTGGAAHASICQFDFRREAEEGSPVNQVAPLSKSPHFVGRERELAALTAGLDGAL